MPSLCTTRSMDTSLKSTPNILSELSKTTLTDARLPLDSPPAPLNMRSSPFLPRRLFMDCSPRTNLNASATLDLPDPFGPTTDVMGELNSRTLFFAKDLNPESSMDFKYIISNYTIFIDFI